MNSSKINYRVIESCYGTSITRHRRKTAYMLFNGQGKPVRLIKWADWLKLKEIWPDKVAEEGLRVASVWVLVQLKEDADA
jgi:hypothetical protein